MQMNSDGGGEHSVFDSRPLLFVSHIRLRVRRIISTCSRRGVPAITVK